ncbi:hypothetical protein AUJ66_04440 [Candidatus Desantisbacteria bacterium CG1_02_38_46]|uniref:Phage-Barnase-EndoU-ColicinE5/D-RelE like nuclease 3 domain-containing protein n=1 Tax=Candidatus Desantisbacteria bacterium CG1_02_38_46 TaxID=1817893 RepID=A0A1J4SCI1_9BACT|nr:MAG: hypothetical protein AUJ66_04440 [Candidatus Desantisbacteria bacterium CG1_02_38_46]
MFKVKDPRGITVSLSRVCWNNHIIPEHPIMKHFHKEIKQTLEDPDCIFQSKISKTSHLYFRGHTHFKYGHFYLLVVVEIKVHHGYVKTSFPVYNLSKGGELLWKKD